MKLTFKQEIEILTCIFANKLRVAHWLGPGGVVVYLLIFVVIC